MKEPKQVETIAYKAFDKWRKAAYKNCRENEWKDYISIRDNINYWSEHKEKLSEKQYTVIKRRILDEEIILQTAQVEKMAIGI